MKIQIVTVNDKTVATHVQSFLFFNSEAGEIKYTTFPNTNLCLAIYGSNEVNYLNGKDQNYCNIVYGNKLYQSRIYGLHEQPFNVNLSGTLDQICILFHPGALRAFTDLPFEELLKSSNAFDLIFQDSNAKLFESLFNEINLKKRALILELFLKKRIEEKSIRMPAPEVIATLKGQINSSLRITDLAKESAISPSTLYRNFYNCIGQSPKMFLKTLRFRVALSYISNQHSLSLTAIAYKSSYYDQAHFIRDIKSFTGCTPYQLRKHLTTEQEQLMWLYNK
ncbi:MAG TPA: helix-turn-helix domain-containing protein [Mucilaginibacter sp.]|nr:helix-turn-helix domain-containing protein [Mucilaginibacter sp.]